MGYMLNWALGLSSLGLLRNPSCPYEDIVKKSNLPANVLALEKVMIREYKIKRILKLEWWTKAKETLITTTSWMSLRNKESLICEWSVVKYHLKSRNLEINIQQMDSLNDSQRIPLCLLVIWMLIRDLALKKKKTVFMSPINLLCLQIMKG